MKKKQKVYNKNQKTWKKLDQKQKNIEKTKLWTKNQKTSKKTKSGPKTKNIEKNKKNKKAIFQDSWTGQVLCSFCICWNNSRSTFWLYGLLHACRPAPWSNCAEEQRAQTVASSSLVWHLPAQWSHANVTGPVILEECLVLLSVICPIILKWQRLKPWKRKLRTKWQKDSGKSWGKKRPCVEVVHHQTHRAWTSWWAQP